MAQVLQPISEFTGKGDAVADVDAALAANTDLAISYDNDGNIEFYVSNGAVAAQTFVLQAKPDSFGRGGSGVGDITMVVAAGDVGFITKHAIEGFGGTGQITVSGTGAPDAACLVGIYRKRNLK